MLFVLNYAANGGSGAPSSQSWSGDASHHSFTISTTRPSRTGYTFRGWALSSSATTATYQPGGTFSASPGTNTLYAVWSAIIYPVTYYPGEYGTGNSFSSAKTYNVALTLAGASFTRTGYTQTGWATSDGGAQAYALGGSYTANAAVTLYPVWTAGKSTISTQNGTLGTAQTITITRYNSSYTHTLTYKYGNATGTIVTKTSSTTPSWTPATSLASEFPSATSGTCTITCETFNGNTSLGTTTTTCTLSIPSSICCTVGTVTLTEAVSGLASKFGAFIQGKSKATISATINSGSGSPAYGATVSSYAITTNGQTLTSNGATTGILNTSDSNSYSFKITDTRGYSNTKTGTYTVLAYSSPSVSAQISRNSSDSSKIDVKYSYSISACNNRNDKALSIKYRVVDGNYTTIPITISSYTGSNIAYQITGLDGNTAYEVVVTVTDYFTSASTTTNIQPTGNRIFDISDDDKTIARHGTNYSDGWDHQYFNEQFHGVLDVTPRRCHAKLSSAGWYRVLKCQSPIAYYYSGIIIKFYISVYGSQSSAHEISLAVTRNEGAKFYGEHSANFQEYVEAIRATSDGTNLFVDIKWNRAVERDVTIYFDAFPDIDWQSYITAQSLQDVGDSPYGETELVRYTFEANTITDISSNFALNTSGISGLTGKIHAIYDASSGLVHLNFSVYTASVTFGTSTPIFTCSNSRYAPKATTYGNGMIRLYNGEWYPYEIGIGTTGNIFQALTGDATRVYGQITYPV